MKVLLDTDIGTDIDDALCLAYLLRHPRCELLGITTVSGDVQRRAALADAVCRAADRSDIPVIAGCAEGFQGHVIQPEVPQATILEQFDHRPPGEFAPGRAVEFLREQILANPGEITLLGIGPTTNLGRLFSRAPEVAQDLRRLVLMCGVYTGFAGRLMLETNARLDPPATAVVYRAQVREHFSVGLDVTLQCRLPTAECLVRFHQMGGPFQVVSAMAETWAHEQIIFHDPLAAATIFRPELCRWENGSVTIVEESGSTSFTAGNVEHHIAVQVDVDSFFRDYFQSHPEPGPG